MRILIACEFSGVVRDAFKAAGHDAWSCDLLPTEVPGQHIQADVLGILDQGWDLMEVAERRGLRPLLMLEPGRNPGPS